MGRHRTANAGVSIYNTEQHKVERKKRKASDISIFSGGGGGGTSGAGTSTSANAAPSTSIAHGRVRRTASRRAVQRQGGTLAPLGTVFPIQIFLLV